MLRLGLRLTVALACFWLLPILLIRAQPYDDGGLRSFLTTGDCTVPCFLNITPGVTPLHEADRIISAQEWVGQVQRSVDTLSGQPGAVFWTWNGQQSPFFADSGRGSIRSFNGERVSEVQVEIGLTFGDVWLSLGSPDASAATIQGTNFPDISMAFITLYPEFAILGVIDCPYHTTIWYANVTLRLRREQFFPGPYLPSSEPIGQRAMKMEQGWCFD